MNDKINISLEKIKDAEVRKIINIVLERTGLTENELDNQVNAKYFAENFTSVLCEILIKNNFFGDFKFLHLIQKNNDFNLKGGYMAYRGKGLANVKEIDPCALPANCNLTLEQTVRFEDLMPIITFQASDVTNEFCLGQVFCSDEKIMNFIQMIKNDLIKAISLHVEEIIEKNFANTANYNGEMVIEVENNDEKSIVKAILKAYHLLMNKNKLNIKKNLTKTPASRIYGLLNISSKVDYMSVLSCCQNSEIRMGALYDRLQTSDLFNENLVGVIYDADTYPIQFGTAKHHSVQCPQLPIIQKEYVFQKYAGGLSTFVSRIFIKLKSTQPAKELSEDLTVKELGEIAKPVDVTKIKEAIKAKNANVKLEDVDIEDIEESKAKAKGKNSYKGEVEITFTLT